MSPVRLAQWLRLSAPCTAVSARVPAATHGHSEGALSPGFCRKFLGCLVNFRLVGSIYMLRGAPKGMIALSQISENRTVETRTFLIFQYPVCGFCLQMADLRQSHASGYWTEGNNLQYLELPSANGVCAWPSGLQERGRVKHAAATPGLKGVQQGNPHSQQTRGDQK